MANRLDDCGEDDDLACASPKLQVIVVVRNMSKRMLRSVLLHEVGHLIGLPDIEGDATHGAVPRPTSFDETNGPRIYSGLD